MRQFTLRRVLAAALIATAFAFSGCSTTGGTHSVEPASVPAQSAPTHTATPAETAAAEAEQQLAHAAEQSQPAAPGTTAPEEHEDLFDRIRAGFAMEDVEDSSIDQQLAWYTTHPQYLERTFTRGERYLYHIVTELEARKMPLELALLPVVESAFEPFGYSRARASGLWQFISSTGKRYGLKQNWWYDGRRDVIESTRAALDYLQALHQEFGDWKLAVAAYNCGELNVQRAIDENLKANKPTDFWNLKLPRETRAYVPKLMAMKRLVANPGDYGVELAAIANVPFFGAVSTGGQIDLQLASEMAGITQEEFTYLNPAYNRWATDPDGPHQLLLPIDACEAFSENLAELPDEDRIRVTNYEVKKGDTLSSIASRNGTTVAALVELNNLTSQKVHRGQELMLPGGGGSLHPKVVLAAKRYDHPSAPRMSKGKGRNKGYHVVRSGDTLWSIARRYGLKVQNLASMNGLKPNAVLTVGRKLLLKGG